MSYEETVKDIEKTFGMLPGFFKNTPKDVLPQMWLPCNKEFIDMRTAKEHIDSTSHELMERQHSIVQPDYNQ